MKIRKLLLVLLITNSSLSWCQNIDTVYYNIKWEKTQNINEYHYYSIIEYDTIDLLYQVTDYYHTGQIQMTGQYASLDPKIKNGEFNWFYPNGTKKMFCQYKIDTLQIIEKFNKEGISLGKVYKGAYINQLSESERKEIGLKPEKRLDKMAEFPGGSGKLREFLIKNLVYPKEALDKKIEGRVFLSISISKNGKIGKIKVMNNKNTVDPHLQKEAIRVIRAMPDWEPAIDNGKKIKSTFNLPISFKL